MGSKSRFEICCVKERMIFSLLALQTIFVPTMGLYVPTALRIRTSLIQHRALPSEEAAGGFKLDISTVSISKPMGILLEEVEPRSIEAGVRIARIDPNGAASTADILVHDRLLSVDNKSCEGLSFDEVMDLLIGAAGPLVELRVGRPTSNPSFVVVRWPNGIGVGCYSGEPLKNIAVRAIYPVKYSCDSGGCATCEHKLRDEMEGTERYVRPCVARVPKGSPRLKVLRSDRIGVVEDGR